MRSIGLILVSFGFSSGILAATLTETPPAKVYHFSQVNRIHGISEKNGVPVAAIKLNPQAEGPYDLLVGSRQLGGFVPTGHKVPDLNQIDLAATLRYIESQYQAGSAPEPAVVQAKLANLPSQPSASAVPSSRLPNPMQPLQRHSNIPAPSMSLALPMKAAPAPQKPPKSFAGGYNYFSAGACPPPSPPVRVSACRPRVNGNLTAKVAAIQAQAAAQRVQFARSAQVRPAPAPQAARRQRVASVPTNTRLVGLPSASGSAILRRR